MADATTPAAGDPVPSASKTPDQAKESQKRATKPEELAPAVELEHGEKSDYQKRLEEQQREALKDPWGSTPPQMRDSHDPAVDPQNEDAPSGLAAIPNGLEPGISNDDREDDQKVSGSLPPV